MSENKFIQHLKGKATAGSVVEIKNQATPASFANMPSGTSNANNVYADVRGNATVVAQGTTNWKLDGANLVLASSVSGDGNDYTGVYGASGAGLWVNATYTFPSTGDPNHPVAMIFNPNTKWVLKLCGDNLLANGSNTIDFSLVITIGSSNIITKNFTVAEQANKFCKEFIIDFAESNQVLIKAQGTTTMQVQLLCATASATAHIYNGMTVFTALQRRVDGGTVATDQKTFTDVIQDIDDINADIADIQSDIDDINNKIIVRSATIPTASADLVGKVYQYAGTTNGQYTHNYIYECVAGETTYSWVRVDVQPDRIAQIQALQADVSDIQALIPAQATPQNQLGDKNFINSSIATNTANFIGTFNSVAELEAYSGTITNNDYAFVVGTDSAGNTTYNRYKYNANTQQWIYEYTLNNSSFTAQQWATINSGATANDVALARSAVQPSGVGNGIITITQGGTTKGSFTTNQSNNTTIDIDAGGGGSGLNVGDTFLTKRTDNALNGAVECDGATYNTTDFTGAESIGELLEAGKLDYVSLAAYSTAISTKGWCDKIGWNGTGNTQFRVPTLNAHIVQTNNIPVVGNGMTLGFTDGTNNYGLEVTGNNPNNYLFRTGDYGKTVGQNGGDGSTGTSAVVYGISTDPTKSGIIADTSDTAQLRVMIQLATGATDQALETCTGVLADVATLKGYDYVVEFQAPTADNNYTWYRKYKSGWVEQGGFVNDVAAIKTINLLIPMANTNYQIQCTSSYDTNDATLYQPHVDSKTTTSFKSASYGERGGATNTNGAAVFWEVKGMAAS